MEKNERFFHMMEHPEDYSDEQLKEIFADPECRDLYDAMLLTETAFQMDDARKQTLQALKEKEWDEFEEKHLADSLDKPQHIKISQGNNHRPLFCTRKIAAAVTLIFLLSGIAVAAISLGRHFHLFPSTNTEKEQYPEMTTNVPFSASKEGQKDSLAMEAICTFENVPLDSLLIDIATHYGKTLLIQNQHAHHLRLFYRWNRQSTLEMVVADLNNFEQVHLALKDDQLILEP